MRTAHDARVTRLFDVGNILMGSGGDDRVFEPILEDVKAELDGNPLDLYVMTHEHMDHVQGLLYGKKEHQIELDVDYAWLTASAAEDYYDRFPNAKKKMQLFRGVYEGIKKQLAAAPLAVRASWGPLLANNNPRATRDCVSYIRGLARHTHYVLPRLRRAQRSRLPGRLLRDLGAGGRHERLLRTIPARQPWA